MGFVTRARPWAYDSRRQRSKSRAPWMKARLTSEAVVTR